MPLSPTFSRDFQDRLKWYNWNRNHTSYQNMLLEQKVAFLDKLCYELVKTCAELAYEIDQQNSDKQLILPVGVKINGDLRKFG